MTTQPKLPLIYRMVAIMDPLPKRGIEDAHRSVVNRLRRYSASSIVEIALQMMWNPPVPEIEELRSAPWLTLLLVKWALQHNGVSLRVGPPISQSEFDRLRQQLWSLQGNEYGARDTPNVWLMLRTILHAQVEFQRGQGWGFLRWPALYSKLEPGSMSRRQFRQVIGMEPNDFMDLAYALYAAVIQGNMPLAPDFLSSLRPSYGAAVDQIYALFARDLPGLRAELQDDKAQRIRGRQELYEFPYLRRFPLIRLRDGRLHCWHPLVFARGLEDAVHLRLSELGEDYAKPFSRVFEQYVTALAVNSGITALEENDYKKQVGDQAASVEAILEGDDCNIFIEAKMSLFADDVLLQDNETVIFNKTNSLRKAIKQGWNVGGLLRDPASGFGSRFSKEQDFLLVVTSRELIIGGGDALQRLYTPGVFGYPDDDAKCRLPLSNVFILSIEDFENTMGCVGAGEVNLSALLKESAIANQNGQSARMFFSDFLAKYTKRWSLPSVLESAREAAEDRLSDALGGDTALRTPDDA